jgi:hypothetical protein
VRLPLAPASAQAAAAIRELVSAAGIAPARAAAAAAR